MKNRILLYIGALTLIICGASCNDENRGGNPNLSVQVELPQIDKESEKTDLVFLVKENLQVGYEFEGKEAAIEDISLINEILEEFGRKGEDLKIIIKVESNKVGSDSVVKEVMNELQKNKISKFSLITPDENK